jgi:undecaprenyl-diphosphatase
MNYLQAWDQAIMYSLKEKHWPWLNEVMKFLSQMGERITLTWFGLAVVVLFMVFRQFRTAAIFALAALLSLGIAESTKHVVKRERPAGFDIPGINRPGSWSFPSGHALNSMAIYGAAALLGARRLRPRWMKAFLIALGVTLGLLIGASRPYLGVHWPTDVFGGWCAGLACALLAYWADDRWVPLRAQSAPEAAAPGAPQPTSIQQISDSGRYQQADPGGHPPD